METETMDRVLKVENILKKEISQLEKLLGKELPVNIQLSEVSKETLEEYRNEEISPYFVLKFEDKLFVTVIPRELSLASASILGKHKCGAPGRECRRLSAATDEEGGCEKVRDRATGIEKYPWIKRGYETFGTVHDVFVVITCDHYELCPSLEGNN